MYRGTRIGVTALIQLRKKVPFLSLVWITTEIPTLCPLHLRQLKYRYISHQPIDRWHHLHIKHLKDQHTSIKYPHLGFLWQLEWIPNIILEGRTRIIYNDILRLFWLLQIQEECTPTHQAYLASSSKTSNIRDYNNYSSSVTSEDIRLRPNANHSFDHHQTEPKTHTRERFSRSGMCLPAGKNPNSTEVHGTIYLITVFWCNYGKNPNSTEGHGTIYVRIILFLTKISLARIWWRHFFDFSQYIRFTIVRH